MEIERIYLHTILQKCTCVKKAKREGRERELGVRPLVCIVLMSSGAQDLTHSCGLRSSWYSQNKNIERRKKKEKKKELNTTMSHLSQSNQ